ncbi:MAG: hypothetical protein K6G11_06540, partial [Lachnospiraceae bacterium]|nr:hypothetical protein [Lachnospiraceae bacterium]
MKLFVVEKQVEGQRLILYLRKILPNASSGFLYKMLRKKNIVLNGKKADGNELIKATDEIQIFFSDETFDKFAGDDIAGNHNQNVTKYSGESNWNSNMNSGNNNENSESKIGKNTVDNKGNFRKNSENKNEKSIIKFNKNSDGNYGNFSKYSGNKNEKSEKKFDKNSGETIGDQLHLIKDNLLYEDENIIVVNKPENVLSQKAGR